MFEVVAYNHLSMNSVAGVSTSVTLTKSCLPSSSIAMHHKYSQKLVQNYISKTNRQVHLPLSHRQIKLIKLVQLYSPLYMAGGCCSSSLWLPRGHELLNLGREEKSIISCVDEDPDTEEFDVDAEDAKLAPKPALLTSSTSPLWSSWA